MSRIKRLLRQILGLFPSKLPNGMTEFESWVDRFQKTYKLPTNDSDSIKSTLTAVIMHLGPQTAYKSLFFFYLTMKAGAAKQIAHKIFSDIHIKQKQEAEKLKAQQQNQQDVGSNAKVEQPT